MDTEAVYAKLESDSAELVKSFAFEAMENRPEAVITIARSGTLYRITLVEGAEPVS